MKTWDALIHMQKLGKLRSIGVSNFGIPHLEALKKYGRPMPAVNQIEMHPMNYQDFGSCQHPSSNTASLKLPIRRQCASSFECIKNIKEVSKFSQDRVVLPYDMYTAQEGVFFIHRTVRFCCISCASPLTVWSPHRHALK